MNTALISSLLGIAVCALQAATSEEELKISVYVWPPGSEIYLGECVLLQCSINSNSSFLWSYRWFKSKPHPGPTSKSIPNPRHPVSGDSYTIAAVTREDAGRYWCQAERWDSNVSSVVLLSQPTVFSVLEQPRHSMTLTPSSRQVFRGEDFTVQCPVTQTNSSGWMLRQFSPGRRVRKRVLHTDWCSPLGCVASTVMSDTCTFTAVGGNSGLYWCEGTEGRSNAVNITVSYGPIILKSPAFPVSKGDTVVLYCQYWTGNQSNTVFLKNGAEIGNCSSSGRVTKMTLVNVTKEDEGFYKCVSQDRKMESPESWLAVKLENGKFTSTNGIELPTSGPWKWIIGSCGLVLLFLIPLIVWSVRHHRFQALCTHKWWPFFKEDLPVVGIPATKQDATEVQWDLSWMEMSNLLDKQVYPST